MPEVGDLDITVIIILATFVIWIVWDVYVYLTDKPTISDHVVKWGYISRPVAFLAGFICGHWFW